jgi:hypothetical protein
MKRESEQGILAFFFKPGAGGLPVLPVLAGCLLLMIWVSFGLRGWVYLSGGPGSQSGELMLFLADPLAALLSGGVLVYLTRSNSTNGGHLFGLLAILSGLFFTRLLTGELPPLSPLLIFQIGFTYFAGWFGAFIASRQYEMWRKYRGGPPTRKSTIARPVNASYRTLRSRLGGDDATARRLIEQERLRHPSHSYSQLIQDALDGLERDYNRS